MEIEMIVRGGPFDGLSFTVPVQVLARPVIISRGEVTMLYRQTHRSNQFAIVEPL